MDWWNRMPEWSARVAVIGAGVSGLAAIAALRQAGHDVSAFEATDTVGGLWNEVYDSVHLLSAKSASGFPGFPMPEEYPAFPSGEQFLAYIRSYAEHEQLGSSIRLSTKVLEAEPIDGGRGGWVLHLSTGEALRFGALVIANGHLSTPVVPEALASRFVGEQIHTCEYRNMGAIAGDRVLVVGAGNSACDMAIDAVAAGKTTFMSVRSGVWMVPYSFFGRPRADLKSFNRLPKAISAVLTRWMTILANGRPEAYGFPPPRNSNFNAVPPTISTLLPYWIQRGRIDVRPGIQTIEGSLVHFSDGTVEDVDAIVWATGYQTSLPFLPAETLTWVDGVPARKVGGVLSADLANLYFNGLASPRGGSPHNYSMSARTIAKLIAAQARRSEPLASTVFGSEPGSGRMDYLLRDWQRLLNRAERRISTDV